MNNDVTGILGIFAPDWLRTYRIFAIIGQSMLLSLIDYRAKQ